MPPHCARIGCGHCPQRLPRRLRLLAMTYGVDVGDVTNRETPSGVTIIARPSGSKYQRALPAESGVGLADRGRYFLVSARKYPKKPTQGVKSSSRLTREPLENPPCPVYCTVVQGFGVARGADLEKFQNVMGRKRNEAPSIAGASDVSVLLDRRRTGMLIVTFLTN